MLFGRALPGSQVPQEPRQPRARAFMRGQAAGESFRTMHAAGFGEVPRDVSFTPGSW
jgi:hypothetical protein